MDVNESINLAIRLIEVKIDELQESIAQLSDLRDPIIEEMTRDGKDTGASKKRKGKVGTAPVRKTKSAPNVDPGRPFQYGKAGISRNRIQQCIVGIGMPSTVEEIKADLETRFRVKAKTADIEALLKNNPDMFEWTSGDRWLAIRKLKDGSEEG